MSQAEAGENPKVTTDDRWVAKRRPGCVNLS